MNWSDYLNKGFGKRKKSRTPEWVKDLQRKKGKQVELFSEKKEEKTDKEKAEDKAAAAELEKLLSKQRIAISFGKPEKFEKPITYVLSNAGVFEVRKNKIGEFTAKLEKCEKFPEDGIEEGLKLYIPKIPVVLLHEIIGFFKHVNAEKSTEAHAQIFYNEEKKEYFIHIPEQSVTSTHVDYKHDDEIQKTHTLVMDIHSHNTMGAFFSGTDDKDEVRDQFYGVIGKIENQDPEMAFRINCGGKHIDMDMEKIFEVPTKAYQFPKEWMNQIKEKSVKGEEVTYYGWQHGGGSGREIDFDRFHSEGMKEDKAESYYEAIGSSMDKDDIEKIIERHESDKPVRKRGIHDLTDDEFWDREGYEAGRDNFDINEIDDDDEELLLETMAAADLADHIVDRKKEEWAEILCFLMKEDPKFMNDFVNKYNHMRKKKNGKS